MNHRWAFTAAWLMFWASCSGAWAAASTFLRGSVPYAIDVWQTDEGLPQKSVISMVQTRDGYLWLGTLNGLARFDGIRFTVFDENNTPGLSSSEIVYLFEDSADNLWAGTQTAGVVLIKDGRSTGLDIGRGSREGRLMAACEAANGAVWLYTADGQLWRYWEGKRDVWNVGRNRFSSCRALITEKSGLMWVGMDQALFAIDPGATHNSSALVVKESPPVQQKLDFLLASERGGHWRLMDGRIKLWTTNGVERDWAYPWTNDVAVTAACEDGQGNLVVGTLGAGVFWFDASGKATSLSTNDGLSNNSILSLHTDREGSLWVGTDGGGLNRVKRPAFESLEASLGSTVQSVCEDIEGGLWMGFNAIPGPNATGAALWKAGALQRFGRDEGLLNSSVWAVLADRSQRVWAGTWGGLFQLENGAFHPVKDATPGRPVVLAIHQDRSNRLWLGTQSGLARKDGIAWRIYTTRDGLSANEVRAIADDPEGNLWIGTRGGGLNRLRDDQFVSFHKPDGLPSENISSLYADKDGVLWIGTAGSGLARHHKGKWTRYTTGQGLTSNSIGYLIEDDQGYLWIGSNAGLMRVPKKALNDFSQGLTSFIPCRAYGSRDGLPDSECTPGSQPGACRTRDGKFWFPTIKGLAFVNPAQLRLNTNRPPVKIESVLIDGQEQHTNGIRASLPLVVTVPAGKERLDIQYTSLNLAAPDKARFKYRLESYETAWTEADDSRWARYPKLPPGHYRFHVTACNEDGVWNEAGGSLAFVVQPPYWRTWWFLTAAALGLLGTIVAVVHYLSTQKLHRQLERLRQQEALERERSRIARDIHDQLGASLTQVALLGELVESDKDSPVEVAAHAQQISQTARDTTRTLDEIVWTVNPSNDTLEGLINYVCTYAQEYLAVAELRYRLDVPAQLPGVPIPPEVRHNVFLASKEAVTNVVRHARASEVWIRLRLEPAGFALEIQDNGRGVAGLDANAPQTRNGLRNMRRRMEDIGGSFSIGPAPDGGALIRLSVPIVNR